jgi:hypothetical protein
MKSTCHIAYTQNLIPTPYMQQRETRKEEQKKERNINPKHNKDTYASPSPPTKDAHTDAKK